MAERGTQTKPRRARTWLRGAFRRGKPEGVIEFADRRDRALARIGMKKVQRAMRPAVTGTRGGAA